MTPPLFTRVDHLVVAVRDLDSAAHAYGDMLGLAPSWRGVHPAYGTANTIFGLANCYLELLAPGPGTAAHPVAATLRSYLERKPEGLFALALGTPDPAVTAAALAARDVATTPVEVGEAVAETGARRRWRSFVVPREAARGVTVIGIAHESPAAIPRAEPGGEAASVVSGVDHVVIFSDDMEAALALWRDRFAIPERWRREIPERGTLNVGLRLGRVTIELVAPLGAGAGERGERLWGVAYAVGNCDAAVARIRRSGVPVTDTRPGLAPATRIATVRWEDRLPTLLIEHRRHPA